MKKPALVIFDLDGTLVDSAPDLAEAVGRTLGELGLPSPGEARIRAWVGHGARQLLSSALAWAGQPDAPVLAEREFERFMRHYGDCLCVQTRVYPGTVEALDALAQQGAKLAVCTNKPHRHVEPLLTALGLAPHFRAWLGGDALPTRKPDAAPLLWLAREAGCEARDSLMVGDSRTDILAARAAGMPVVVLEHGYPAQEPIDDADGRLPGFAALPDWIHRCRSTLWPDPLESGRSD